MAAHGSATGHGGIWKSCADSPGCYELRNARTFWYFQSGAKANMDAGGDAYFAIADRNWPAIQAESQGHPWAPHCFNTNFLA